MLWTIFTDNLIFSTNIYRIWQFSCPNVEINGYFNQPKDDWVDDSTYFQQQKKHWEKKKGTNIQNNRFLKDSLQKLGS